eukprot:2960283-Amphidinium_carterae.1
MTYNHCNIVNNMNIHVHPTPSPYYAFSQCVPHLRHIVRRQCALVRLCVASWQHDLKGPVQERDFYPHRYDQCWENTHLF